LSRREFHIGDPAVLSLKEISDLIQGFPADDDDSAKQACGKLVAAGPKTIETLILMVGSKFGDKEGVQPKYAVHALTSYVCRPGAEKERQMFAETLAGQLDGDNTNDLKAFIIRQLQLCGREQDVPALAKTLNSEALKETTVQALTAIGGNAADKALSGV
jgi:hypothetical protein